MSARRGKPDRGLHGPTTRRRGPRLLGLVAPLPGRAAPAGDPDRRRAKGSDDVVRTFGTLAVVAMVALVVLHLLSVAVLFDLNLWFFNADADDSVWGWAGVVASFTASAGAVVLAVLHDHLFRIWVLAALVAFLSFDDFAMFHERLSRLGEALPFDHAGRVVWPLLLLPIMVVIGLLLLQVARSAPGASARSIMVGLAGLAVAVVLEMLSPLALALGEGYTAWPYSIEVAIEEALELGGWIAIAGGLLGTVVANGRAK